MAEGLTKQPVRCAICHQHGREVKPRSYLINLSTLIIDAPDGAGMSTVFMTGVLYVEEIPAGILSADMMSHWSERVALTIIYLFSGTIPDGGVIWVYQKRLLAWVKECGTSARPTQERAHLGNQVTVDG